jgi:hypothetical protein
MLQAPDVSVRSSLHAGRTPCRRLVCTCRQAAAGYICFRLQYHFLQTGHKTLTTITCQPSPFVDATARVGFRGLAGLLARGMSCCAPLARVVLRCCRVVPMTTSVVTCHKALLERTRTHGPSRQAQPIAARLHQSAGPMTDDNQEEALLSEPSAPPLRADC